MYARILVSLLLLFSIAYAADAQNWQVYRSPYQRFQLLIPKGPVRYTPPHSAKLKDTFIAKGVAVYQFGEVPSTGFPRYSAFVFKYSNKESKEMRAHRNWLRYIAVMALGDDDEPQFLSDPKNIEENGLSGKEFIYMMDGTRKRFSKGRFFEVRSKLYVLCFEARSKEDLESADGEKFLRSFKLL